VTSKSACEFCKRLRQVSEPVKEESPFCSACLAVRIACAERDQLAARVEAAEAELATWLKWARDGLRCTPEERAVLKAMDRVAQEDVEHWLTFTDDDKNERALYLLGQAELANRATKAKKNI
jgi:hypothetical protein